MTSAEVRGLLFLKESVDLDPYKIPATLSRVFKDFQKEHPEDHAVRLCCHNLLIVCSSPKEARGLATDMDELLQQYPGRAVVVVLDAEHTGPVVGFFCVYTRRHQMAGQLIGLHFPASGAPLPSMVAPLWQDGMPLVTIWRGNPPYEESWFLALVENCTRLVVNSGIEEGVRPLRPLWALIRDPYLASQAFTDVSWARLCVWRDWIAGLFDRPDRRKLLAHVDCVELEGWSLPGDTVPHLSVLYLAAWLSQQLAWQLTQPLAPVPGGFEARLNHFPVRFYTRSSDDPELLGRPVRVTFRGHSNGQSFRLSVERDSNDSSTLVLGATGPACGGAGGHRLHLERLNNLALMGQELETDRRDTLFEKALETLLAMCLQVEVV
ncbi:glucose-6-phosphate dehydrogenase assembly protein OpcA [bacterium]|nr:glucose-6-phosphate dehydrogenase assembly protein OpcA [bacterium]